MLCDLMHEPWYVMYDGWTHIRCGLIIADYFFGLFVCACDIVHVRGCMYVRAVVLGAWQRHVINGKHATHIGDG